MKLPATRFTLLMWLVSAGGSACYAQGKTACDLFTKADAESVLGVPAERFSVPGMAADRCQFRQVGWQSNPPNDKLIDVYLGSAEAGRYAANLTSSIRFLDGAPKRDLKELTDLGDAAFWHWSAYDGGSAGITAFKGGNIMAAVSVFGIPEDAAFAHAKRIVLMLLGGAAKTGYVYPGSPAQKGYALSVLPISDDALGGKVPAASERQVAALRGNGQRVLQCVYNPLTRPTTYYYWYGSPPDNMGQLLASQPSSPLAVLGGSGARSCPETLELAQRKNETLQGPCSRLHFGDREWTNEEVLTLLAARCEVILSPRGQSFIAGLSDYLASTCHLPADRTARAEITTFLSAAFLVASAGSQRSNPRVLTAVGDQLSNAFAYKAGNEYMTKPKQEIGCDDKTFDPPKRAEDIVYYLKNTVNVNGGEPRFVPGCVKYYSQRPQHYTQEQCQCVADLGRAVTPNIHQAEFSPTIIRSIISKNIPVAALVAARCGIFNY